MPRLLVLSLLMLASAVSLTAEPNSFFPRHRMFIDIRDTEVKSQGFNPGRYFDSQGDETSIKKTDGAYDSELMRAGASVSGFTEYMWRDFLLVDDPAVAFDAYFAWYGVELSIWSLVHTDAPEGVSNPYETDYRISYTFDYWQSINTIAYTHYDFGNSHEAIGFQSQGFGKEPIEFADTQNELHLSSYFFNDVIAPKGANNFLGLEAFVWLDEGGFRGQAVIGMSAAQPDESGIWYAPNTGLVSASFVGQSHYHTETSSFIGSNFHAEFGWDWREAGTPMALTFYLDYFLPWGDDTYRDRIIYGFQLEFRWSGSKDLGIASLFE